MLWYYGVILMPLFVGIVLVLVLVLVLEPTVLETSLVKSLALTFTFLPLWSLSVEICMCYTTAECEQSCTIHNSRLTRYNLTNFCFCSGVYITDSVVITSTNVVYYGSGTVV